MSICMEGEFDDKNMLLEGMWHFASSKEAKNIPLKYTYKWKSESIPKSLYDRLAFHLTEEELKEKQKLLKTKREGTLSSSMEASSLVDDNDANLKDLSSDTTDTHLPQSIVEDDAPADDSNLKMIDRKHKLFGMWEGHFEYIPGQPDHIVEEAFFIHAYVGFDSPPHLSDLPFEPSFSYSLLGVDDAIIRRFIKNLDPSYEFYTEITKKMPKESTSSSKFLINNDASATFSSERVVPTAIANDIIMVWGFGTNSIGRFSVVGSYVPSTGRLICEKKYILSKGWKRSRKYNLHPNLTPKPGDLFDEDVRVPRIRIPSSTFMSKFLDSPKLSISSNYPQNKRKKISRSKNIGDKIPEEKSPTMCENTRGDESSLLLNDDFRSAFVDDDTGEVYEGGWFAGVRHGYGICLHNDGTMYEGNWVYGKQSGKGQLMTSERVTIYDGDWFDGLMHGQGVYNYSNGDVYKGDWKEGNRHGKGEYLFKGGCRYVGDFKESRRTGKGIFSWPDGSTYDGEWENDKRHGKGVLSLIGGFKYDGYWVNNYAEGRGVCLFPSGQEYQGGFKQGLREGRGSIKFSEGAEYEGRFRDDRIDGQGTIKIHGVVPGASENEIFIPIQIQADIKRIHMKAGFGETSH